MSGQTIKGRIPEKWFHCPKNGVKLIQGKFMPFKTPLSEYFDAQLTPEHRFLPQNMFDLANQNQVKIGLWVNLTNTNRYYHKSAVLNNNCEFLKISCEGHGVSPSWERTKLFIESVHNYICKNPVDIIVVHCTHGFNRTGFLIVSFLVEKLHMEVTEALAKFANARPPGIYRHCYIKELYRRYDKTNTVYKFPPLPCWYAIDDPNRKKVPFRKGV